jgi:hypothetical protein
MAPEPPWCVRWEPNFVGLDTRVAGPFPVGRPLTLKSAWFWSSREGLGLVLTEEMVEPIALTPGVRPTRTSSFTSYKTIDMYIS